MKKQGIWMLAGLAAATAAAFSQGSPVIQSFRQGCAAKAAEAARTGNLTVVGKDGWLFFAPELRHVSLGPFWGADAARVSKASNPASADPLPAILDFKRQLDHEGIQLLIVPVPPKVTVYPDKLFNQFGPGSIPRLDTADEQFYGVLRQNGVPVLDLYPDLVAHRDDPDGPVYCKTDTHWSGRACVLAARAIAAAIKDRPWLARTPRHTYAQEWHNVQIDGDLRAALGAKAPPEETIPLRFVGTKAGGEIAPVQPSRESPVILLGDSHTLVFHEGGDMLARGAGLPDQLAYELGFPVDLIGVRGSGATPSRINLLRRARANPDYLKQKRLVIWCFTTREFTENDDGWLKVPVVKL